MFDKEAIIAAYNERRDELIELVNSLTPAELEKPTACEGWNVKDLVAHMATSATNVQMLMNRHIAREPNAGVSALNARNALGVTERKGKSVQELVDELSKCHEKNIGYFRGLADAQLSIENTLVSGQAIAAAQRFENAGLHYLEHGDQIRKATGRV